MRIGYVLKKYPRLSETFILNELLELERQGMEVTVFSLHTPDEGVFHPGVAKLRGPVVYVVDRKIRAFTELLRENRDLLTSWRMDLFAGIEAALADPNGQPLQELRAALTIAIEARRRGIDHLHAHFATVATRVARLAHLISGVRYSFTCHAKDIYREDIRPELFAPLVANADFAVTVCDANREHIRDRLLAGTDLDVIRLYNGIDLELFERRNVAAPDGRARRHRIVAVGRLVAKKGFHTLIESAGLLRDRGVPVSVEIIGDGEEEPRLRTLIHERGLDEHVTLAGARAQEYVRQRLAEADVVALPCTVTGDGDRDALPTVLLEALATGVPVVSTPIAGVAEILGGGQAGIIIPPDRPDELADALAELLGDEAARVALSEAGRARAEELFDLRKNVRTLRELFATAGRAGRFLEVLS